MGREVVSIIRFLYCPAYGNSMQPRCGNSRLYLCLVDLKCLIKSAAYKSRLLRFHNFHFTFKEQFSVVNFKETKKNWDFRIDFCCLLSLFIFRTFFILNKLVFWLEIGEIVGGGRAGPSSSHSCDHGRACNHKHPWTCAKGSERIKLWHAHGSC